MLLARNAKGLKWCILGGTIKPGMVSIQKYLPEIYKADAWGNYAPPQFGYGVPFAQGSRLYIRSTSHLHCVGK